ncbi:3-hydroxyisobutyryl-CoA hydrolase [Ornithinimicrobium tianjinense]|uniref:3-hydroxyisobutyryl-CoA hydrolase n=1 Tax=Ornithinimicrobium tianjinense TaxID=1195761 RepID=A0A917BTZ2_9MICO|nr:3-hydroxyisobutyryl-CoA hydrolase [Ornithinimicrobium tianjinense]GGF54366.1 3-hydroxyisobutyryl-CoA hydrolase [Ornithinimicrobium tianjinense]
MSESDEQLSWAPAPGHGDEVLYAVDGPLGRVRLHRPRAINALDLAAVESLRAQLAAWADDPAVEAVFLDGAGERGLCAGGDVRALRDAVQGGDHAAAEHYWEVEYAVDRQVVDFPKPYVAWMDGIVMGGGVGVSAHGSVRLVTERTRLAMPEVIIGFFPDVGGLWFLAHAPGELGTHVALTGAPVGAADAVVLGMADVVVPSSTKEVVLEALRADPQAGATALAERAEEGRDGDGDLPVEGSWLEANRSWIDECYAGDDAEVILDRLLGHESPEAREAGALVAARSPHSVAVTLEAVRRAASMDVHEVLEQDTLLGAAFARHPDFAEGVRAQVVDKDREPRWADGSVADVSRDQVLAAFGEA